MQPQRAGRAEEGPRDAQVGRPETLRVWLLGGFRVSVGIRTVEEGAWRLRKAAALVKLLALAPSHHLHRERAMDRGASPFRDGEFLGAETIARCVTAELAYVVEIERGEAKVGGSEEATPWALRATMIFRPEEGTWKVVHRHADPITTEQPAESMIQE